MSLVKFNVALSIFDVKDVKVGGALKVLGVTKKIVIIDSFKINEGIVMITGLCEDFRQEPANQLSMFGVDGL